MPIRKRIRLKDYDYSQIGAYFITICVNERQESLGRINVGEGLTLPTIQLSGFGEMVKNTIESLPNKYPHFSVDNFVIMPNHLHLILHIHGRVDPFPTVGQIIGFLKYQTTKEIGIKGFWQRSYHDHIIRNEEDYLKIWHYIDTNPQQWQEDCFYSNTTR